MTLFLGQTRNEIPILGHQTNCTLDNQGRIISLSLPDTSEISLSYDNRSNINAITDPQGVETTYEYDALNRVTKAINGEGAETVFEYNKSGNITKVTNAQGNTRTYDYNLSGAVTRITDFDGGVMQYKYNPIGKIEEVIDQQGNAIKVAYDLMQNPTTITNPTGSTINYEYDQYNRIVRTIDPEGNATDYKHDPNGNVIAVTSPLGTQTKITYDALNRQKSITEPDGAVTKLTYDANGDVTHITDALGNTTIREYDQAGQITKITDPLGNKTKLTYTALGQIESVENAKGQRQTYSYYPGGNLKAVTMPDGESESYEYNKNGKVNKVTDALGNTTTLTYDCLDRVIKTTNPLCHSKHFTYNALGNITSITDENGNTTQYKYSPLGDIIEVIDAMGNSTMYDYDAARRLTKLIQSQSQPELTAASALTSHYQITTYEYNKKGEVIAVTNPLGDIVKYTYDKAGKVISKYDEEHLETLYEYNLVGNLSKISYADGKTVALTYNALKQLIEMKDWLGTTSIELDALGRTTKTTDHEGNKVGYVWNEIGQREKLIYPDGKEVSYEYTPSGRLKTVKTRNGIASADITNLDITSYTYDPMGRISERVLPNSTTTKYEFNPLGSLASLTHSRDNNILDQFKYAYDPTGNITQIEKHRQDIEADNGIFQYAYDPLNRLTQATKAINPTIPSTTTTQSIKTYTYDNLGNRISSLQNGIETRHMFNARNQLIKTFEGESGGNSEGSSNITDYQYDNRGNLTQITKNGQLQSAFTFDAANMMTTATTQGKGSAEYTYNGFMSRVKKLESYQPNQHSQNGTSATGEPSSIISTILPDPCKEVKYILDMTRPYDNLIMTQGRGLNEQEQGTHGQATQSQSYIWGNTLLSASGTNSFHYLHDHLGSPIRLMSGCNTSVGDNYNNNTPLTYDEFGVPDMLPGHSSHTSQTDSYANFNNHNPFGFTGYQTDDISGMYYAQARYYAPTVGRFMAEDPIKDQQNWYGYCNANPLAFVDPMGLAKSPHLSNKQAQCETANIQFGGIGVVGLIALQLLGNINNSSGLPSPSGLTQAAYLLLLFSREDFNIIRDIADQARSAGIAYAWINGFTATETSIFGSRELPVTWDNEADAYRHFLWTFYMTMALDADAALTAGNAIELFGLYDFNMVNDIRRTTNSQSVVSTRMNQPTIMDLWNNAVGRNMAESGDFESGHDAFIYALENGMLITDAHSVYSLFGLTPHLVSDWSVNTVWFPDTDRIFVIREDGSVAVIRFGQW